MSWFARSLADSLGLDHHPAATVDPPASDGEESPSGRGVREDLSELTETLTRRLQGVASFLAPPPQPGAPETSPPLLDSRASGSEDPVGSRGISDAEGDGGEEDEDEGSGGGAIGLTEEVLSFARNISMHPETWLDCPLLPDEDEPDDFEMSDAQHEHSLAIEYLVPRLAALRIELCPVHMSEECFWKIYFVLLHPRLHKEDAEYLSTPQIVEARAFMLQELQNRIKLDIDRLVRSRSNKESTTSAHTREQYLSASGGIPDSVLLKMENNEEMMPIISVSGTEAEKQPAMMAESKILDKYVSEGQRPEASRTCHASIEGYEDEDDAWLADDDDVIEVNGSGVAIAQIDNEDISFSDLEDSD